MNVYKKILYIIFVSLKQLKKIIMSQSIKTNKSKSIIYPELGETTKAAMKYKVTYSGKLYVTTDLELKGQGLKLIGNGSDHKRCKKTYIATKTAMDELKKNHEVCYLASF
jgi:hypothetical protein